MNRLRFLAMRGRPEDRTDTLLSALGDQLGEAKGEPEPANTGAIPEPALVALAAIHAFNPGWIRSPDVLGSETNPQVSELQVRFEDWKSFDEMRAEHRKHWGWDLAKWRGTFLRMSADVSVR
jgi:hypothetical protein